MREDGSLLVVASATDWGTMESRILLLELDRAGEELGRSYVGDPKSSAHDIVPVGDGDYLLFGYIVSGEEEGQIARIDSAGALLWIKSIPGVYYLTPGIVLPSSGEIVFGTNSGAAAGSPPTSIPGLLYLSAAGDSVRSATYEDELAFWIGTLAVAPINGGLVLAGFESTPLGDRSGHLLKVDDQGAREWSLTFGGGYIEHLDDIVEDPEGNYVVTGVGHTQAGGGDLYAAKISETGELLWELYAGGPGRDEGSAVTIDGDGGYVLAGETAAGGSNERLYLVKANAGGEILWEVVSDVPNSAGEAIQLDSDGNYVIVGWAQGPEDPEDVYVARYQPSTVTRREPALPETAGSLSVFPNPAAGRLVLEYHWPAPGWKHVELFDVGGRSVMSQSEWMDVSGAVRLELPRSAIGSGLYLLRVFDGNRQVTTPVTLILDR
ncbi:MAG: T9SS type A sorting domain-containing protein [Rhodothermales bacterium]